MAHHRTAYSSQNDAMEDLLASKVGSLKDIAIKIGDEARYQNKMLAEMVSTKFNTFFILHARILL